VTDILVAGALVIEYTTSFSTPTRTPTPVGTNTPTSVPTVTQTSQPTLQNATFIYACSERRTSKPEVEGMAIPLRGTRDKRVQSIINNAIMTYLRFGVP
jgi:hypothetical protein